MRKSQNPKLSLDELEKKRMSYNISQSDYDSCCAHLLCEGFKIEDIQYVILRKKGIAKGHLMHQRYQELLAYDFNHQQIARLFALSADISVLEQCLEHIPEWILKYSQDEILSMTASRFSAKNIELLTTKQAQMENIGLLPDQIARILSKPSGYEIILERLRIVSHAVQEMDVDDQPFIALIDSRVSPISDSGLGFFDRQPAQDAQSMQPVQEAQVLPNQQLSSDSEHDEFEFDLSIMDDAFRYVG